MVTDENPHRIYRYNMGGEMLRLNAYKGGGRTATPAAKCRCNWEGIGEDAIREHQLLMDSWRPPPNARSTDPQTSHDAAGQTEKKYARGIVLLRAYAEAGPLGLTTEEAGIVTGLADDQDSGYWKRRSDLSRQGYLMRTGQTRRSTQNREQQVYAITRDGLELLEALGV